MMQKIYIRHQNHRNDVNQVQVKKIKHLRHVFHQQVVQLMCPIQLQRLLIIMKVNFNRIKTISMIQIFIHRLIQDSIQHIHLLIRQ